MVRNVRDRLDLALPVLRASSSSEPGGSAAQKARLPFFLPGNRAGTFFG
jgi:hypothetical protein